MKTFKVYLEESRKAAIAALALTGAAMAAPPKPEATEYIVDYMKQKEGFRPVAEPDKDAKGNPVVVGYGTTHVYPDTKKPIKVGEKITPEKGEELIKASIEKDITPKMEKIPNWDEMDPGKQAALLSFGYNVGHNFYGAKGYETITQNLKNKEWDKVPETLKMYNKGGGKVLRGLTTRREQEGKMWSEGLPTQTSKPASTPKVEAPKPITTPKVETPKQQATTQKPITQPQKTETTDSYEVKSGDNLSKIAKQYGKTVQDIVKLNPEIKDPNKIQPGQKIKTK
jgi:GH24 family phage-related lysozyme (muramidase)